MLTSLVSLYGMRRAALWSMADEAMCLAERISRIA